MTMEKKKSDPYANTVWLCNTYDWLSWGDLTNHSRAWGHRSGHGGMAVQDRAEERT